MGLLREKQWVEDGQSACLSSCRPPEVMMAKQQAELEDFVFCRSADLFEQEGDE